jgi:hypothetical protein
MLTVFDNFFHVSVPLRNKKCHACHYFFHCRLVKTAPCIAVFNSSLTIVVIALDRHRVIVHSGRQQVREYMLNSLCLCVQMFTMLIETIEINYLEKGLHIVAT